MTREENLYHQLRHYFNLEYDERNKDAVVKMIKEYKEEVMVDKSIVDFSKIKISKAANPRSKYKRARPKNSKRYMIDKARYICQQFGITVEELKVNSPAEAYGKNKPLSRCYSLPRKMFCRACWDRRVTLKEIGEFLGHIDHTSVRYHIRCKTSLKRSILKFQKEHANTSFKNVA